MNEIQRTLLNMSLQSSSLGWSKIFMYENSILRKTAIVPLQESDFVAKFESN